MLVVGIGLDCDVYGIMLKVEYLKKHYKKNDFISYKEKYRSNTTIYEISALYNIFSFFLYNSCTLMYRNIWYQNWL